VSQVFNTCAPGWCSGTTLIVAKIPAALTPAAAAGSIGANEGRISRVGSDEGARACGKRKREQQNDWPGFPYDPHRLVSSKMRQSSRTILASATVRGETLSMGAAW
jgi:hypothetical protein